LAIEDLDIRILPFTAERALHWFDCRFLMAIPGSSNHHPSLGRENSGFTPDDKFSLHPGLKLIG